MFATIFAAATLASTALELPKYGIDAPYPNVYNGVIYAPTPFTISAENTYRTRIIALREEAIEQQSSDGGTLTEEHRTELQHKLDRIQRRFAETRRQADIHSVDASGQGIYSAGTKPKFVQPPRIR